VTQACAYDFTVAIFNSQCFILWFTTMHTSRAWPVIQEYIFTTHDVAS